MQSTIINWTILKKIARDTVSNKGDMRTMKRENGSDWDTAKENCQQHNQIQLYNVIYFAYLYTNIGTGTGSVLIFTRTDSNLYGPEKDHAFQMEKYGYSKDDV